MFWKYTLKCQYTSSKKYIYIYIHRNLCTRAFTVLQNLVYIKKCEFNCQTVTNDDKQTKKVERKKINTPIYWPQKIASKYDSLLRLLVCTVEGTKETQWSLATSTTGTGVIMSLQHESLVLFLPKFCSTYTLAVCW